MDGKFAISAVEQGAIHHEEIMSSLREQFDEDADFLYSLDNILSIAQSKFDENDISSDIENMQNLATEIDALEQQP